MRIVVPRDNQQDISFEGDLIASGSDFEGVTECHLYITVAGKYIVAERQTISEDMNIYAATVATTQKEVVEFLTRERRFSDATKELLRRAANHDPAFEEYLFEVVE